MWRECVYSTQEYRREMHFYISRVRPSFLVSALWAQRRRDLLQKEVQNRALKDILLQRA